MNFLTTKKADPTQPERVSDKAIAFGQHIVELEEALSEATQRAVDFEKRATAAENMIEQNNKNYNREIERLTGLLKASKQDEDYYKRRWFETRAKLKASASIILDAMQEEENSPDKFRPSPASVRAVEKALATRNALEGDSKQPMPEIPDFLKGVKEPE